MSEAADLEVIRSTVELDEILPAGGGRYVALVHLRGRGKGSQVPTEGVGANLIEMRGGKIVRLELVWDRDEALARAGLAG